MCKWKNSIPCAAQIQVDKLREFRRVVLHGFSMAKTSGINRGFALIEVDV